MCQALANATCRPRLLYTTGMATTAAAEAAEAARSGKRRMRRRRRSGHLEGGGVLVELLGDGQVRRVHAQRDCHVEARELSERADGSCHVGRRRHAKTERWHFVGEV